MGEVCLCRPGFEMTHKPNLMRKKDEGKKDKHIARKEKHTLLMNGETPSSSFVFLFLQPQQGIFGDSGPSQKPPTLNVTSQ